MDIALWSTIVGLNDGRWLLPVRLALLSMLVTVVLVAAAGVYGLGLPLGAAVPSISSIAPAAVAVTIIGAMERQRIDTPGAPASAVRRGAARRLAAGALAARRRALQLLALGAAAVALGELPARAASVAADPRDIARTFAAFCDTLVPADELTPSASALSVPSVILDEVIGDALAERLVGAGCAWLDDACNGDFAAADEAARVGACERMQALPWESPPGRFFQLLRDTVMAEYYAQPASWSGLALDRPPQPLGFFDAVR